MRVWLFAAAAALAACAEGGGESAFSGAFQAAAAEAAAAPAADPSAAPAGVYRTDPKHAYITFSYDHFGYSRPQVRWRSWSAELIWDSERPEKSSVSVVIDATKPDSGVDAFDQHLRSPDFFNAAEFPQITFKSTSLTRNGPTTGRMVGDLTIKGVTKPVTLDVTLNRAADDSFASAYKLGFSGKGIVKRSDFGVDKYAPNVSDEVTLTIEAEFVKPKEAAAAQ
jgi:polyisoprenoid-binding protein YceI